MPEFKLFTSLHEIDRSAWNNCFLGEVEDYDYLLAVEEAEIENFAWRYLTAWEVDKLIAAAPLFLSDYKLDTTLQGAGKKITTGISRAFPKLLTQKLACLGSPCTETMMLGFDESVINKPALLKQMLNYFEECEGLQGYKLLAIKDIPEKLVSLFDNAFKEEKYSGLPGMPASWLDIDFKTLDEYISRLSHRMRKDLRRKMKSFADLKIVSRNNIDDVLPEVLELYNATRNRSEWQFEELTENYFKNVLAKMPGRATCILYYAEDKLLAANLLLHNEQKLLDKYFCMSKEGRDYNLYFLSWLTNIRICLEQDYTCYESGQANYENKLRLGCKLEQNTMYFKHRNVFAQGLLRLVTPWLSADDSAETTTKEAA